MNFGADSDSTGFNDALGACRGAAGLFNKPQKNSRKRRKLRTSRLIPGSALPLILFLLVEVRKVIPAG
jgi:hypothetical protein